MLHGKIQSTIELIQDVIDNKQKENDNANAAKRNSIFFDSFAKLTPYIKSYILAKKNFGFTLQSNTAAVLQELMSYAKTAFDNAKAVNPSSFKQKSDDFVNMMSKEWEIFYETNHRELINGLNIIVLVHSMPTVVKNCITVFHKCEKLPLSQESIDSYKETRQKADDLMREMKFDDEIRDFLIKVREKQATLTDITPSIMEWIRSENIADKVSLSIRNVV